MSETRVLGRVLLKRDPPGSGQFHIRPVSHAQIHTHKTTASQSAQEACRWRHLLLHHGSISDTSLSLAFFPQSAGARSDFMYDTPGSSDTLAFERAPGTIAVTIKLLKGEEYVIFVRTVGVCVWGGGSQLCLSHSVR